MIGNFQTQKVGHFDRSFTSSLPKETGFSKRSNYSFWSFPGGLGIRWYGFDPRPTNTYKVEFKFFASIESLDNLLAFHVYTFLIVSYLLFVFLTHVTSWVFPFVRCS